MMVMSMKSNVMIRSCFPVLSKRIEAAYQIKAKLPNVGRLSLSNTISYSWIRMKVNITLIRQVKTKKAMYVIKDVNVSG